MESDRKTEAPDLENFPCLGKEEPAAKNRVLGAWSVNLMSKNKQACDELSTQNTHVNAVKEAPEHSLSDVTSLSCQNVKCQTETSSETSSEESSEAASDTYSETSSEAHLADVELSDELKLEDTLEDEQLEEAKYLPLDVPTSMVQMKRAVVIEVLQMDCIRLLANFSQNYTSGYTRAEVISTLPQEKEKITYARHLERCAPVIYGGGAYAILHQALSNLSPPDAGPSENLFRPTTDIDLRCPFPTQHQKKKGWGWSQFTHRSATRAFEVAQDRILELVELLNVTCPPHLKTLKEQGIVLHNQEACEAGLIDFNGLHALARKRPSSRFDHVFPSIGGMGPFFTSFVYNEHAVFYTFKVCYVWSAKDVAMGEPQYAELIELQMVPVLPNKTPLPGFELRLSEKLDEAEWPSLDGEKAPEPEPAASPRPGLRLSWTTDLTPAVSKKHPKVDMRGRVCIEDPRVLADASALAVSNRLARGCCKDGDWEKVLTDEQRVHWLQQVARRRALDKFGTPSEVQEEAVVQCEAALHVRKPQ